MSSMPEWEAFARQIQTSKARSMAISAPVGAGVGHLIEQRVAQEASDGELVVIVVPALVLLEQWVHRLTARDIPVTSLNGSSALLLALDEQPDSLPTAAGVIVMTVQLLIARGQTTGLAELRPDLLVIDRVGVSSDSKSALALRELATRSHRCLLIDDTIDSAPVLDVEQTLRYSLRDLARERHAALTLTFFEPAPDELEAAVRQDATELLNLGHLLKPGASIAELHSQLSRLAAQLIDDSPTALTDAQLARLGGQDLAGLRSRTDALLERIESLGGDPRLDALLKVVERAVKDARPCVISLDRVVDGEYVTSVLRQSGIDVAFLSGMSEPAQREDTLRRFRDGCVLVRTRAQSQGEQLPHRTCHIWWSSPSRAALLRELAQALVSEDVELVTFDRSTATAVGEIDLDQHNPSGWK